MKPLNSSTISALTRIYASEAKRCYVHDQTAGALIRRGLAVRRGTRSGGRAFAERLLQLTQAGESLVRRLVVQRR